jgi:hypothetical protein
MGGACARGASEAESFTRKERGEGGSNCSRRDDTDWRRMDDAEGVEPGSHAPPTAAAATAAAAAVVAGAVLWADDVGGQGLRLGVAAGDGGGVARSCERRAAVPVSGEGPS